MKSDLCKRFFLPEFYRYGATKRKHMLEPALGGQHPILETFPSRGKETNFFPDETMVNYECVCCSRPNNLLKVAKMERHREKLTGHFPSAHNSQGWARPNSGAWYSSLVSHTGRGAKCSGHLLLLFSGTTAGSS